MNYLEQKIKASKGSSNIQIVLGTILFLLAVGNYENTRGNGYIIYILLGILCIFLSFKNKKIVKMATKYIPYLTKSGRYPIANIASMIKIQEDNALKELQMLINKGYIPNAYFDATTNSIVLPDKFYPSSSKKSKASAKEKKDSVICESCGGVNYISKGKSEECEYCGSIIKN